MEFSSSLFVVSQSTAEFKNGVNVVGNVDIPLTIDGVFVGDGSSLSGVEGSSGISLFVGSASNDTPPIFNEWITGSGGIHDITISVSSSGGHLNHYSFIKEEDGAWVTKQGFEIESQWGITEQTSYEVKDLETGIYRYLIYGHSKASKTTLVKGTTVTINPGLI